MKLAQGDAWTDPAARDQYKTQRMLHAVTNNTDSTDGVVVAPDAPTDASAVGLRLEKAEINKMHQPDNIAKYMQDYEQFFSPKYKGDKIQRHPLNQLGSRVVQG